MRAQAALQAIQKHGILLVFPIANRKEPLSIWTVLNPRSKMRWEWDESADSRVVQLWHLKEALSRSGKVAYAKWYQNRATFFSLEIFCSLLRVLEPWKMKPSSKAAGSILKILEENSPQSSKNLNQRLRGEGFTKAEIEKGMKELWEGLYLIGYGEIEDGAFPSLAIGATQSLFPEVWQRASQLDYDEERKKIAEQIEPSFEAYLKKILSKRPARTPSKSILTFDEIFR